MFQTKICKLGVGICWDQWFPEAARCMALLGADVLLYPTAIGSEPADPTYSSTAHWIRVMQGHAAANMVPVIAANRYKTCCALCHNCFQDWHRKQYNFVHHVLWKFFYYGQLREFSNARRCQFRVCNKCCH